MTGYDIVLFDLDHTLLDSDASLAAAFDATMRSIGIEDPGSVYERFDQINQALWRRVESEGLSPNDVKVMRFRQLLDELERDGDPEAMGATFVQALIDHGELYPGARNLLDELDGSVRMAMITNGIGRVQRGRIDRLDLGRYFEAVTISGEVGTSKPGNEIFEMTLDALGVADRSAIVMIGDSLPSDITGAANSGIDSVWYNPAGKPNHSLVRPTHEIARFDQIVALVAPPT